MTTHVCDGPVMTRDWTSRRCARRRGLKGEAKAPSIGWLSHSVLPTAQHDGLRANELDIDPEIADVPAFRRIEPAQELAQTVTVRDDVHGGPVDRRRFLVVYRVCGGEERKHRISRHTGRILVHKIGAVVRLKCERDVLASPQSRRTCEEYNDIRPSELWAISSQGKTVPGTTIVGSSLSTQLYDAT